jgi:hypothetical protein
MLAAALPAPTTMTRPLGLAGSQLDRQFSGVAEVTAVSNSALRSGFGSIIISEYFYLI